MTFFIVVLEYQKKPSRRRTNNHPLPMSSGCPTPAQLTAAAIAAANAPSATTVQQTPTVSLAANREIATVGPRVFWRETPELNYPRPEVERSTRESSAWRSQQSDNNERYGRFRPRDSDGTLLLQSTLQGHYDYVRNNSYATKNAAHGHSTPSRRSSVARPRSRRYP